MFSKKLTITALALLIIAAAATQSATAQESFSVDYRLTKWKTIHFDDAKKADLHLQTVKSLGCEGKMENHGGHVDVAYRCLKWRRINLKSHDSAHRWQAWLKASGFETKHKH